MGEIVFTPVEEIEQASTVALHEWRCANIQNTKQIRTDLKNGFKSKKLQSIAYRKNQVLQLAYLVQDNIAAFSAALKADLGRPELEAAL